MSLVEKVTDLECSICLQHFHDPIILNCGHTFDRLCIEKVIDRNKSSESIRCPRCNYTINAENPFISNKSLSYAIKCEPTFEWFLIDISSTQQKPNVLTFLRTVFNKREIFETNHITVEIGSVRMTVNSNTNFDQNLEIKALSNLENKLQEICAYFKNQDGLRKICILTDGSTKHFNLTKIDSNIIHQRFIIHIGDKNQTRTRELADKINFQFGYFNEKTLVNYVQHFLTNF